MHCVNYEFPDSLPGKLPRSNIPPDTHNAKLNMHESALRMPSLDAGSTHSLYTNAKLACLTFFNKCQDFEPTSTLSSARSDR